MSEFSVLFFRFRVLIFRVFFSFSVLSFPCFQISTEEQRQEVTDLGSATEDWLYDEGRTADVSAFKLKHADIR